MTDTAAPQRALLPVPDTRRTFGGTAYELAESPAGYVYKSDSHILHAADCGHGLNHALEPRARESVSEAWRSAPDLPVDEQVDPRFCQTCLALPVDRTPSTRPHQRADRIAAVSQAARVVLDHLLGDQRSVIDPQAVIWTSAHAERLRAAIDDNLDTGSGTFFQKLEGQLAGAPREVFLLAAEILYLRAVPLMSLTVRKKREHISTVLSWIPDSPTIPPAMAAGLESGGSFAGGRGYNQHLPRQVTWLARFTLRWDRLDQTQRELSRQDPWRFRAVVNDDSKDLPTMRNCMLFMAFPETFESVVNDDHKWSIRNAFASVMNGATGDDGEAIDRDLLAIRQRLEADGSSEDRLDWYVEPWESQWQKGKDAGDRAWAVRSKPAGLELIEQWLEEGYVSLAASHLGELPEKTDRASVRERINAGYDHLDYAQRMYLTDDYFAFLSRMRDGDVVAARHDERVWLGTIAGEVTYSDEAPRLRRGVDWRPEPLVLADLPSPAPSLLGSARSVIDLTDAHDALLALIADDPDTEVTHVDDEVSEPVGPLALRAATPSLAADLHMGQDWLNEFIEVLGSRRQAILYGPPGTGKTYLARKLAQHLTDEAAVQLVQFHPSYAYEDFFEGYRPTPQADGGLGFELRPGPLRRIASIAANDPSTPYVLIIDEINRGNIAKVFGELYFLLEYRGEKVALQYSPEREFSLPENLFVIGTMNTADRSIALIDAAIRRRFSFIEMHPDSEPVRGLLGRWLDANYKRDGRAGLLEALNAELGEAHRDFQIGPSYLMRPEADDEGGLARIWRHDIIPLLDEHFYGQLTSAQVAERFGLAALRRRTADTAVDDQEIFAVADEDETERASDEQ